MDPPTVKDWNPRFVAYARSQGRTPEDQAGFDDELYPGGRMTGFILWMSHQWEKFRGNRSRYTPWSQEDYAAFDAMIGVEPDEPHKEG
jgi:hypothetical protein